jgi:hypothetical protein
VSASVRLIDHLELSGLPCRVNFVKITRAFFRAVQLAESSRGPACEWRHTGGRKSILRWDHRTVHCNRLLDGIR